MTSLKNKSDHNFKAADFLLNKALNGPSVHCSYYSCVQLMLHVLRSDLKKSESEVEKEGESGSKIEGGFHNWLINLIIKELFARKDFMLTRDFTTFVGQLKALRIKADYKNVEINATKAKDSIDIAKQVMAILQAKFTI